MPSRSQMADPCNLSCYNCGSIGLIDGFDGFYYCTRCGSQADDIIDTGVADEDVRIRDAGGGGPLYSQSHTRRRKPAVLKVEPLSQSQPQDLFGASQSEFWNSLNLKEDPYCSEARNDDDIVMFNDGVGPTGPEDFGSDGVLPATPCFEEYADEVRMRYVMGLQLMMELQCEALVKEFKASPVICGLAASIWLRYLTATRVFDEGWAFEAIQDSEIQYEDPENIKPVSSRHKAEPHNLYGQRVVVVWVKSLRKKIPLSCTLAVSFLACHVAREAILPTDIMKWSLEGKLPYFSAFIDIENRIGKTSRACPISSKHMHRPSRIPPLQKLESLAGSIAHTIGLNLPPVNFYSIACRYLDKLAVPVDKILPHACCIYEWSMPPDLWLSTNELRLPSRVCVMSILIISMRILYNLHGFGVWEKSLCVSSFPPDRKKNSSPANNFSNMHVDSENRPGFTSRNVDSSFVSAKYSHCHKPELTATEFLHKIEAQYHEIAETYEYFKDLPTYLQHCKDVVFAGIESSLVDDEEERLIEECWNYYQNEKDPEHTKDVDQNGDSNPKRLREGSIDRLTSEIKISKGEDGINDEPRNNRTESNNSQQSHSSKRSSENGDDEELSSAEDKASTATSIDGALRRLKLDMEEKRFCYIPPRVNPKRFDYLHYSRKIDRGALTYAAHADYYILLRACARVAQVDVRIMHMGVLSLEKRLSWLEDRINHSLHLTPSIVSCEFCSDDVLDHSAVDSMGLSDMNF